MEIAMVAGSRTIVMFLLMMIGWVLFKTGKITKQGSKDMANLLINVTLPCVIIQSFITEYSVEKAKWILYSLGLSVVCLLLSMLVAHIMFRKSPIDNAGVSFSNGGFIGLPLIQAVLGNEAVIVAAPFIAALNVLQCTYGLWVLDDKKGKVSFSKIVKNPIIISVVIGLVCFFLKISFPAIVTTTISMASGMNAPLAMVVLGIYLAQTELKSLFTSLTVYKNSLARLIIIPALTLALLSFLPDSMYMLKMVLLIECSAPVGSNVAVYAQLKGLDYTYACKTVCMSTLFSIVTIPLILMVAELL